MKKARKLAVIVAMLTLMSSIHVFAAEAPTPQHQHTEACTADTATPAGTVTSYRCLDTGCRAYLEILGIYSVNGCRYCGDNVYLYQCTHCGKQYKICASGVFN